MFRVNGSNLLYKIWGIITLIIGILTAAAGAGILVIYYCFAESDIGKIISDFTKQFDFDATLLVVLAVLIVVLMAVIQISTGSILIKEFLKSKSEFASRQILYILAIIGWVACLLVLAKINSILNSLFFGMISMEKIQTVCIVKIIYDLLTVIFLGCKSSNLIYTENADYPVNNTVSQQQEYFENNYSQPNEGVYQQEQMMTSNQQDMSYSQQEIAASAEIPSGAVLGLFGQFKDQKYVFNAGEDCTIGRDKNCQIQLNHSKVSRVHCTIHRMENGDYLVTDSSTNGTFYENLRLPKGESYEVPKGALLAIGDAENVLQLL